MAGLLGLLVTTTNAALPTPWVNQDRVWSDLILNLDGTINWTEYTRIQSVKVLDDSFSNSVTESTLKEIA